MPYGFILNTEITEAEKSDCRDQTANHTNSSKASHHTLSGGGEKVHLLLSQSPKSTMKYLKFLLLELHLPSKRSHSTRPLQEIMKYFIKTAMYQLISVEIQFSASRLPQLGLQIEIHCKKIGFCLLFW